MNIPLSLLSPWSALVAAAVVPPLVLLYFLKLKRREIPISTTLLWKRAVEDLQVNSPFQRLRNNLLLLLQLLVLLFAVGALTEPMWRRAESREKKMILLVDHSASMNTIEEGGRTRLEIAKEEACRIVDGIGRDDQVMVISFGDRARPVASFTNDKSLLKRQIGEIGPTDAPTRLRDAITLAESYSTPIGENLGTTVSAIAPAHVILLSDGNVEDAGEVVLRRGSMEIVNVGRTDDNVGIVRMDVRRHYEQPEIVTVAARVRNAGARPVSRDVSLLIDGDLRQVRTIRELAGASDAASGASDGPASRPSLMSNDENEIIVTFDQVHATAGRIEVRLSGRDALTTDDRAFATVEAPRPLAILLVTHGNHFLRMALAALTPTSTSGSGLDVLSPEQYAQAKEDALVADGRSRYDVVVFDACSADRLPPGNYVFFGGVPKIDDVAVTGFTENGVFVDWDDTHAVLRHVAMEAVHVLRWNKLALPAEAVPLVHAVDGPVLAYLAKDRRQYLICAFSLFDESRTHLNTNWVMNEGFPVFMYNALHFLTGSGPGGNRSLLPGEAIELSAPPGVPVLRVSRPDGKVDSVPVRANGTAYYGETSRVGFYTPSDGMTSDATFVVNLYNESESSVRPNREFRLGSEVVATASAAARMNRPIWSWLILAALLVLFAEWCVYTRRVWV